VVIIITLVAIVLGALASWLIPDLLSPTPTGSTRAASATGSPSGPSAAAPTPTPTLTPAPAATATPHGKLDSAQADDVVNAALAVPVTKAGTSTDLDELLKNVAVKGYAAELQAQWQELTSQGWTVTGRPVVVSSKVTALHADGTEATAQITTCVDSSAVKILDSAGNRVGDPSATTPRALNLFSLIQGKDGVWRISSHSYPNNPTC
jgi:hypothetical protein